MLGHVATTSQYTRRQIFRFDKTDPSHAHFQHRRNTMQPSCCTSCLNFVWEGHADMHATPHDDEKLERTRRMRRPFRRTTRACVASPRRLLCERKREAATPNLVLHASALTPKWARAHHRAALATHLVVSEIRRGPRHTYEAPP